MSNLSKSTRLMNCLVALSEKTPDFPHPLYDKGFKLEHIEKLFFLQNSQGLADPSIKPDIQFVSMGEKHVLFFECKDGAVDVKQLDKYKRITAEDIKAAKITEISSDLVDFDLAYIGTSSSESKLLMSTTQNSNNFPIVVLGENKIELKGANTFKSGTLNAVFSQIPFTNEVPVSFFPFTASDEDETILVALLQYLLSRSGSDILLDTLLQELFPQCYGYMSEEGKKELKGRMGSLLAKISKEPSFGDRLRMQGNTIKLLKYGPASFQRACLDMIDNLSREEDQKRVQPNLFSEKWGLLNK